MDADRNSQIVVQFECKIRTNSTKDFEPASTEIARNSSANFNTHYTNPRKWMNTSRGIENPTLITGK